jgi:tetratricopeptide (TPR) repeat protein
MMDNRKDTIILIISGALGENIVPVIHDMTQLHAILVFCGNVLRHKEWATKWPKVQHVSASIKDICESLKNVIRKYEHDAVPMSFVSKQTIETMSASENKNIDQLEPSYMYSMLFKEILLEVNVDDTKHLQDLMSYCHEKGITNSKLSEFHKEYQDKTAVTLYTRSDFLYSMLNRALRTLDMETMLKMGFFIRNLHRQLEQLYHEQSHTFNDKFIVYRGQGLSSEDFQHLYATKGGLLAFNNFLSTSIDKNVAMMFSPNALRSRENNIGVLFIMTINSKKVSALTTPFALIENYSVFQQEKEVLFSMHTVFRIQNIHESTENNGVWEVQLTLTDDNDPQLADIISYMRPDTRGSTGWFRMGKLMVTVGHFDQAEILYNELLKDASSDDERADLNHELGAMKFFLGQYKEAVSYCEEELKIKLETFTEDDPSMASSYGNIGGVYRVLRDYSKALELYQKAIKIGEKSFPPNHPTLSFYYNEIGLVYNDMGDYKAALQFFEESYRINENIYPSTHPEVATSCDNVGAVYFRMGDYSKALQLFEKALEIREKVLAPIHHHLAHSYNSVGAIYGKMGDYMKAVQLYEKAHKIFEKAFPRTHPDFLHSCDNIGAVYEKMGDYVKALEFYEKSLEIREEILSATHPDLVSSYNAIAIVCDKMGDYSKAHQFYEKSLKITE